MNFIKIVFVVLLILFIICVIGAVENNSETDKKILLIPKKFNKVEYHQTHMVRTENFHFCIWKKDEKTSLDACFFDEDEQEILLENVLIENRYFDSLIRLIQEDFFLISLENTENMPKRFCIPEVLDKTVSLLYLTGENGKVFSTDLSGGRAGRVLEKFFKETALQAVNKSD